MKSRRKLMNLVGGLPDLAMKAIPDWRLLKNTASRKEYMEKLNFYASREPGNDLLQKPKTAPEFHESASKNKGGFIYERLWHPSGYRTLNPALQAELDSYEKNRNGYLHLWRKKERGERPVVLCAHGFMMGRPGRAFRMFRMNKLLDLGMDAAMYNAPFHSKRSDRGTQHILDPGNVPLSIEANLQNVFDLHSAVLVLRKLGYEKIGLAGASMGGYVSILYAAAGAEVDFIFMAVPSVGFEDYLAPRQRLFDFPVDRELIKMTGKALGIISPLNLSPSCDTDLISVVAHAGDRLCDSKRTRAWARAWDIADYHEVTGGHWLYFDKDTRARVFYGRLERMGFMADSG